RPGFSWDASACGRCFSCSSRTTCFTNATCWRRTAPGAGSTRNSPRRWWTGSCVSTGRRPFASTARTACAPRCATDSRAPREGSGASPWPTGPAEWTAARAGRPGPMLPSRPTPRSWSWPRRPAPRRGWAESPAWSIGCAARGAGFDGRDQQRPGIGSVLGAPRPDLLGEIPIKIGKPLEIALGVAGRNAGRVRRSRTEAGPAARQGLRRPAHHREPQLVGVLLAPLQAGLVAVHAQPQAGLVPGRHLTRPQHAACAALVAQQDVGVVIEPATLDEAAQVGRQLAGVQSRDEAGEMVGVGADVAAADAAAPT